MTDGHDLVCAWDVTLTALVLHDGIFGDTDALCELILRYIELRASCSQVRRKHLLVETHYVSSFLH